MSTDRSGYDLGDLFKDELDDLDAYIRKAATPPQRRAPSIPFEDQPCKICTAPRRICCC